MSGTKFNAAHSLVDTGYVDSYSQGELINPSFQC